MNRNSRLIPTLVLAVAGAAGLLTAIAPAEAQEFPRLAARHRGTGTYENRGSQEKWDLTEARVVLGQGGTAAVELWGRNLQLAMRGRIVKFNGREHVDIVLDTFDGVPTTAKGWVALDRRGGFERIEFDGQSPVRLGISFRSQGPNIEPPPPPPVPEPTPSGVTEEYGVDRRGADYRNFAADGLRTCQNACKDDSRCRAYAYNLNRRVCYLKAEVPDASQNREVTSGVKQGWGGNDGGNNGDGQGQLTEERGFDRRGNDYVDFRARGLADCQDSCRRDNRCRAYSYDTIERTCWLKSRVNSQKRKRDMVTGFKQ
ncbi:MAG: PAN domain-containing protein [Thermoanaerobaculia bacterium]